MARVFNKLKRQFENKQTNKNLTVLRAEAEVGQTLTKGAQACCDQLMGVLRESQASEISGLITFLCPFPILGLFAYNLLLYLIKTRVHYLLSKGTRRKLPLIFAVHASLKIFYSLLSKLERILAYI